MKPPPPVKSRGQHFLKDARVVRRIVEWLAPQPEDVVVEIGPGRGALTSALVETGQTVVAVEPDLRMVEFLRERFGGALTLVHSSVLDVQTDALLLGRGSGAVLAGNLPYNLSGPILEWIFSSARHWRRVVIMLQLEVARRLVASPVSRDFGPLAVARALRFDTGRKFTVRPGAFFPVPKVTSAVVELLPSSRPPLEIDDHQDFMRFVHVLFAHRRKNIRNNLLAADAEGVRLEEALERSRVNGRLRAEQLTWKQLEALYRYCRELAGAPGHDR